MDKDNKNKHLEPETEHIRELKTLFMINQILMSGAGQKQLIAEVLDTLDSELGMNRGTVSLLSPDSNEITIEVAHNMPEKHKRQVRYKVGEGITGKVMQTGKAMVIPKVSEEPLFLNRMERHPTGDEELSFICTPIMIDSKPIGTISIDKLQADADSLDMDMRTLSIVASMIANDVKARWDAALTCQRLEDENLRLRHELEDRFRPENIIGNSGAMRDVYSQIHQVAGSDTTVVVRGESGTGKELVAHAVHYSSPRAKGPFIKVNCAALNENLLESELFGHEKGAFTGAIQGRKGRIEEAQGGTLFLDEIGDFSAATQVKLLRVLQERQFERVGSNKTIESNARIIVATNRNLEEAVADESFRQDLYYRINVFPILIPPLRNRKDDILLLSDYFIEKYSKRMKKDIRRISTPAINMMVAYHWPGNVRELENCIERAVLLSSDSVVHSHHLPPTLQTSDASDTAGAGSLKERVALFERDIIVDALKRCNGSLASTGRDLQTTSRVIGYKVKELQIDHKRYQRKRR
ncbi:MAG: sigma 54-interacting transcriptional regulator [Planctomycetes bacterium]|nr:sigma 54-interacting transcriptional regulator [Planctomycetota bacterium]